MTGPLEAATAATRKHREEIHEEGVCICGWHANTVEDYPTHLAAAVIAALNLTTEQKTLADGGTITLDTKTGETTVTSRPCTRMTRWVTPWVKQ